MGLVEAMVEKVMGEDPSLDRRKLTLQVRTYLANQPAPTVNEVFAGGGLLALAWAIEGAHLGELVEREPFACKVLRANLEGDVKCIDANTWKPKRAEILSGGPPCQPFSKAGTGKGTYDARDMFPAVIRWAREQGPKVIVMENVHDVLAPKNTAWRKQWWADLGKVGYEGVIWVLSAASYGTPQNRIRAFFVAWPKGAPWGKDLRKGPPPTRAFALPRGLGGFPKSWQSPRTVITAPQRGLPAPESAFERLNAGCLDGYGYYTCAFLNQPSMCRGCNGGDNYEWCNDEENMDDMTEKAMAYMAKRRRTKKGGKLGKPRILSYKPADLGGACLHPLGPTMVATLDKGLPRGLVTKAGAVIGSDAEMVTAVKDGLLRMITVREAAKLQDLPQWYNLLSHADRKPALRVIGNGVPVNLGRAVARHVLNALGYPKPTYPLGLWPTGAPLPNVR